MSDDKTTIESREQVETPKEPAKPKKQKPEGNSPKVEINNEKVEGLSKKKQAKSQKAETKKDKKSTSKKNILSQKEIDKLILENADLKANVKENRDNLLLLAAEFENFKKRISKDQLRSKELYKEKMLAGLLPIVDDIDRGLQHHKDDEAAEVLSMLKMKLMTYLESYSITPFDSLGKEFDPDKHDAMLTRAIEDEKNNIVLEEFEKGYMINNKVLRCAKVIVNIVE